MITSFAFFLFDQCLLFKEDYYCEILFFVNNYDYFLTPTYIPHSSFRNVGDLFLLGHPLNEAITLGYTK